MTPEDQIIQLQSELTTLKTDLTKLTATGSTIDSLQTENAKLRKEILTLSLPKPLPSPRIRAHEVVTHDCARHLAASAYFGAEKLGRLAHLTQHNHDLLLDRCAEILGMQTRAALTATDIPLPTDYHSQVVELVWNYGDFRRYTTPFPMGSGTVKLPKLKTSPAFGLLAMSGTIPEKSPQLGFVTFTAEKSGGIVRIPSEIDADSIVPVGQFIARYGAREMAKWEDTWGFLADGTATYDTKSGVCKTADTLGYKIQLSAGKTKPSDLALQDFRDLRAKIDQAAYNGAAYYMNRTMEAKLVTFNTSSTVTPYLASGPNGPSLDGFPIRWVGVLPVYDQTAHVSQYQAIFGDMSYWHFGQRGTLRVDVSNDIYFPTDEIGVRFVERFDPELMADASCAVLQLAAS